MRHANCYIQGYNRPQFVRREFMDLNGKWDFSFDDENNGEVSKWFFNFPKDKKIVVPFSYNTLMSEINDKGIHNNIWYGKDVKFAASDKRVVLNFEGCDYITKLWVNGTFIGKHTGGYARFSFDITDALAADGSCYIVVKSEDTYSATQARGKQKWLDKPFGCWYNETNGIWKGIWAEYVSSTHLNRVKITPDIKDYYIEFEAEITSFRQGVSLRTVVSIDDNIVADSINAIVRDVTNFKLDIHNDFDGFRVHYWEMNNPRLYDIKFELIENGIVIDRVESYTGFRTFRAEKNILLLNNNPMYSRLVLNQGYYKDSGLTAPDEDAILKDIKLIKELGFNGVRMHQKIEDERFFYYADILGLMVWVEMPSAYEYKDRTVDSVMDEWKDVVKQYYNFPSVVCWVPINESWGVPRVVFDKSQQSFTKALYHITKAYDKNRPVISNDGWEHTESDIITLHNYSQSDTELGHFYQNMDKVLNNEYIVDYSQWRLSFAGGCSYNGQPIIISEFAGIGFENNEMSKGWGYGDKVTSKEAYVKRLKDLIIALRRNDRICGFCITQFTDVEAEINGLLDIKREPKAAIGDLAAAITQK